MIYFVPITGGTSAGKEKNIVGVKNPIYMYEKGELKNNQTQEIEKNKNMLGIRAIGQRRVKIQPWE